MKISKAFVLVLLFFSICISISNQAYSQLCQVSEENLELRKKFILNFQTLNQKELDSITRTLRLTKSNLRAMKGAHLASKISLTVSAVAGLVAGGAAISSLYFSGQSVTFVGLTVTPGTMGAHLYSTYSIGSNVITLGQVGWDVWKDEKTPQEYLEEQMKEMSRQALFSQDAILFLTAPTWGGWSDKLQSPLIQEAFLKLDKFYKKNTREINDNGGLWSYIGEFWHKKGLKQAALDHAVATEAVKLQQLRMAYFNLILKVLEEHRRACY